MKTEIIDTKEIAKLSTEITPEILTARRLTIEDTKSMEKATIVLSNLNKYADSVKERKEAITKPINAGLKQIRDIFKPLEAELETGINYIRAEMSRYQTKAIADAKIEEDKIANRVGQGKGKLTVETAIKKLGDIEKPEDKVVTSAGTIRFREDKKLKITNLTIIPREYMIPDEKHILEVLKMGTNVDGCEIEIIQTPINSR